MKKTTLLNQPLSAVIAGMGHKDTLTIGDCGLPVPDGPERIDLAVVKGLPGFLEVLDAVLSELHVEKVTIASEMQAGNPELYAAMRERFQGIEFVEVPHETFKTMSRASRAIVRTGECRAYANIILQSGVTL